MQVGAGQAYVECEAMKMIMQLKTTEAGNIRHNLQVSCIRRPEDMRRGLDIAKINED